MNRSMEGVNEYVKRDAVLEERIEPLDIVPGMSKAREEIGLDRVGDGGELELFGGDVADGR